MVSWRRRDNLTVIASAAKQSMERPKEEWIASSLSLLAMTMEQLQMFPEDDAPVKKPKAVALGKPAAGRCLCGRVAFEIDVPARWAWHDHSPASRRAHGAAYATY